MAIENEQSAIEQHCDRYVLDEICSKYRMDCEVERRLQKVLYIAGFYDGLCLMLPDEARQEIRFISLLALRVWTEK